MTNNPTDEIFTPAHSIVWVNTQGLFIDVAQTALAVRRMADYVGIASLPVSTFDEQWQRDGEQLAALIKRLEAYR